MPEAYTYATTTDRSGNTIRFRSRAEYDNYRSARTASEQAYQQRLGLRSASNETLAERRRRQQRREQQTAFLREVQRNMRRGMAASR